MHNLSENNWDFFVYAEFQTLSSTESLETFSKKSYYLSFILEHISAVEMHTNFNENDDFLKLYLLH